MAGKFNIWNIYTFYNIIKLLISVSNPDILHV